MIHTFPSARGRALMQGRLEEFDEQLQGRGSRRRKLYLAASVAQSDTGSAVDIFNISKTGLLLATSGRLDLDEPLTVVLPEVGERSASIVWFAENLYGCRFEEPLSESEIDACVNLSAPEGPAPAQAATPEESFGERLKRLRSASGLTMIALAERVGVTKPTLWKWETGKVMPRPAALERLAQELGLTAAELMYGRQGKTVARPADSNPPKRNPEAETLAEVIARSRREIAQRAGTSSAQVVIDIDWG